MPTLFNNIPGHSNRRQNVLKAAASAAWWMPRPFGIARTLGPSYSLRSVVFHDVSAEESLFTRGMGVNIPPSRFESALKFLVSHYKPVSLDEVLSDCNGRGLPERAVLITFDDGYSSLLESAIPLCRKEGIPAVFFLNAAFLDNRRLAPDNLVCYALNVLGMDAINAAAQAVKGRTAPRFQFLAEVLGDFFPSISLVERRNFLDVLIRLLGSSESQLAGDANLYLTNQQVRHLASLGFEIGNHTYSHVRCRRLSELDLCEEVDHNKAELESLSGKEVRSFSVPYGSSADLTGELLCHLQRSGHQAVFLSESVANRRGADHLSLNRVSPHAAGGAGFFAEIEILPRLRAIRNRLHGGPARVVDATGTRTPEAV